jgi:hypothetical protein
MTDTINIILSAVLAVLTLIYVYFTYRLFSVSSKGVESQARPVLAISVSNIRMGHKFLDGNRQDFSVAYTIQNIGNSAAIAISLDCEVRLLHTQVEGASEIPQRFPPDIVNFLPSGERYEHSFSFGNKACSLIREDYKDSERMNLKRIELNPTQEAIGSPVVIVSAYYRNIHGDLFVSRFTSSFSPFRNEPDGRGGFRFAGWGMPDRDEDISFSLIRYKELSFETKSMSQKQVDQEMAQREQRRHLSGW